jgi:hypothetical protein
LIDRSVTASPHPAQFSSTSIVSLRCHFNKETFGKRFKNVIVSTYFVL